MNNPVPRNNHRLIKSHFYMGYKIMQEKGPFIEAHLNRLIETIHQALEQYSKVFAFRMDLRFPYGMQTVSDEEASEALSRFLRYFKEAIESGLANKRHKSKVRYCWCREVGARSGRLHYHLVILLNGNAYNSLGYYKSENRNLFSVICSCWARALRMDSSKVEETVHFPENCFYLLNRSSETKTSDLVYRASYLCKEGTKCFGDRRRNFVASRG